MRAERSLQAGRYLPIGGGMWAREGPLRRKKNEEVPAQFHGKFTKASCCRNMLLVDLT